MNSLTQFLLYVIFLIIKPFAESTMWSGGPIFVAFATWGESF